MHWLGLAALALSGWLAAGASGQVSPFEEVRWGEAGPPEVLVRGAWYVPVSIDGVSYAALLTAAEQHYRDRAMVEKRLDEDLLDIFELLGEPKPDNTVDLRLRPVWGGDIAVFRDAPMTRENRQKLWRRRHERDPQTGEDLSRSPLKASECAALLDRAAHLLETRHSYSAARASMPGGRPIDEALREAVERARDELAAERNSEDVPLDTLVRALEGLLAISGDGHARVRGRAASIAETMAERRGSLPIAAMPLDLHPAGRVVAVENQGRGLVDPAFPYLAAIDGVGIERWLAIAAEVAPGGSAQSRRYGACRALGSVAWIRDRLGLPASESIKLTLADAEGQRREVERSLATSPALGYRKQAAEAAPEALDGAAYLAIRQMWSPDGARDRERFEAIRRALENARDAKAVIIDIRGNTGGTRDVLHLVASYVMAPDAEPAVYSAARVLMWEGRDPAQVRRNLRARRLHLPDSPRWNEAEREAVSAFLQRFQPEVDLPDERFGPLHVSVLSPGGPGHGLLAGKPVLILIDERCISAADVFAAAMAELPDITLIGRPTRGASGMSREHEIGRQLRLKLSSMVSFMPDGRIFDWRGVAPDVPVELAPKDFTRAGPDTALERAIDHAR